MRENYTRQAQEAIKLAEETAKKYKHNYVGTEHLLMGLLKQGEGTASAVLAEFHIDEEKLAGLIDKLIAPPAEVLTDGPRGYTPRAERVIESAAQEAANLDGDKVGTEHLLMALLKETDCVGTRLLHTLEVNIQKLYAAILVDIGESGRFTKEELNSGRAMRLSGNNASSTQTLDQYSRDLTALAAEGKLDPIVGRDREIGRIVQILSRRTKNNPCLIGEPGVGKTAIAEGLAQRIVWGLAPDTVQDKRVVVLDLSSMVAGSKYRGEFEERIKNVVREVAQNKNILLFIDELHTIIGAGGAEGSLDASNILKPSLSRGEIQLIGATTIEEYRKYIEKDAALERRFQPVMVDEPDEKATIEILRGLRPYYEEHHGVTISDEAIEAAVKMSVRYINDRFLPDKALDLIDEASSKVQLSIFQAPKAALDAEAQAQQLYLEKELAVKSGDFKKARELQKEQEDTEKQVEKERQKYKKKNKGGDLIVDENAIADVVSDWTKIPVKKLAEGESKRLAKLERELHKRVIGQEEAVHAVSQAVKRGRVGLKDPGRPIGSFLFLGPTGVGKTELSKALAEAVFGSEQAIIRVDMSEYMEKHSVSKMIGSPPGYVGYDEGGQLSEKVRRHPYSVILFDEIEKAHPDVFNILLQVLDDGHITDAQGRKIDFKNTILIMTSNAGAESIISPKRLGFASKDDEGERYKLMKDRVMEEVKRMFKPEFINRIDEIMVFHPLNQEHMKEIVSIMLRTIVKRTARQMNLDLEVKEDAKAFLVEKGYDEKYGARPLRRAIQNHLEDKLAEAILDGSVKAGEPVVVNVEDGALKFFAGELIHN